MAVEVQSLDAEHPPGRLLRHAARILEAGGVVVYPTDTVYGMGSDILCKSAVERIFKIKKVSKHKLMSFICAELNGISEWAFVPDYAYRILRRVTPGPYTFILRATRNVPKVLLQNRQTIGIRITQSPVAAGLVRQLNRPLLNTSVPFGEDGFSTDPAEIAKSFRHQIELILDAGVISSPPSTIVDLTGAQPVILREGAGDPTLVA